MILAWESPFNFIISWVNIVFCTIMAIQQARNRDYALLFSYKVTWLNGTFYLLQ